MIINELGLPFDYELYAKLLDVVFLAVLGISVLS